VNSERNGKPWKVHAVTIDNETASFFSGCYFNTYRSGNAIILESGAKIEITKQQVEAYNFEDARI